jgi:hypothetical protein
MEWRVFFAVIFSALAYGALAARAPYWAGLWVVVAALFWGAAA